MSDRYIEKSFLYLLALSILLHVALYQLISLIPAEKPKTAEQTTMVDLSELPKLPPEPARPKAPPPQARVEQPRVKQSVPKRLPPLSRTAPLAKPPANIPVARPPRVVRTPLQTDSASKSDAKATPRSALSPQARPKAAETPAIPAERGQAAPVARGEGLFKPKARAAKETISRANLFPSAGNQASLEEKYRNKYMRDVEEGKAIFLNTDDVRFTSFVHRLENAIYGVWEYPIAAQLHGIQGTVLVRVTFNRNGEVTDIDVLEGAGSKILDDEVLRTLHHIGPIGSLPKQYTGDSLKMLLFFIYGGSGRLR